MVLIIFINEEVRNMFFDDKIAQLRISNSLKEYNDLYRLLHENKHINVELEFIKQFRR